MLSNRIKNLAPPPRSVPLTVACSAMGGSTGWFGALFLLMGLVFTVIFTAGFHPLDDLRLALEGTTATGRITMVVETNSTENDVPVYAYDYAFTTKREQNVTGRSYTTGREWKNGASVQIDYVPEAPVISRIHGARSSSFSVWVLFVLIFPAIGATMFFSGAVDGLRQVWLLRNGVIADAQIQSAQPTGVSINEVPVLKFTYEIRTAAGETATGTAKSLPKDRIGDEQAEPALHLPGNPFRSTLVDAISLSYQLDVDQTTGQWVSNESRFKAALYLLTWLAAVLLGGYWTLNMLSILR
jgi:hypothetical protein